MVVTLTGSNSFAIRRRLNELVESFVTKHGQLALERVDAEEAEAASVKESILSLPFLTPRKMIVVRSGSTSLQFSTEIEQIINSIPDTTDLVLHEPITDKRTTFYKILKTKTKFEEYPELDRKALAQWLIEEAKKAAGTLSLADAQYLIERLGTNQELLYNELQKLIVFDQKVVRENIDLLTEPMPQSKVFDLLDAAFGGQKARALKLYEDQRSQKVEPQAILAMIAWQLQLLTLVKLAANKNPAEIAKESGVNPYPLNKAAGLAEKLSQSKLRQMVNDALRIDLQSKTTGLDLDEALKTYIVTL